MQVAQSIMHVEKVADLSMSGRVIWSTWSLLPDTYRIKKLISPPTPQDFDAGVSWHVCVRASVILPKEEFIFFPGWFDPDENQSKCLLEMETPRKDKVGN